MLIKWPWRGLYQQFKWTHRANILRFFCILSVLPPPSLPQEPPTVPSPPLTPPVENSFPLLPPLELLSLELPQLMPSVITKTLNSLEDPPKLMLTTPMFVYTLKCPVCTPPLPERLSPTDHTLLLEIFTTSRDLPLKRSPPSRNMSPGSL